MNEFWVSLFFSLTLSANKKNALCLSVVYVVSRVSFSNRRATLRDETTGALSAFICSDYKRVTKYPSFLCGKEENDAVTTTKKT